MFNGKREPGDLNARRVTVHPALGAPYGQPVGQRVNLGRVGQGQTASVTYGNVGAQACAALAAKLRACGNRYEPLEDEGSML